MAECECEDESPGADEKPKEENGKKRVLREGEKRLREWVSAVKVCQSLVNPTPCRCPTSTTN